MKEKKEKKQNGYFRHMAEAIKMELREHKSSFMVYLILRILVIVMLVLQVLNQNYENVFLCILTLLLLIVPSFVQVTFKIELPTTLEIIVLFFIFAAEILGEINEFYLLFPFWDTVLHTPVFTAIVAFCFSMTIGVVWEFFEFGMDQILGFDMQKDTVLFAITSVMLNPDGRNVPVTIDQIREVLINGQPLGVGGYLDIGLIDTMEDLFVNFIGAAVFSVIGFFYVRSRGKGVAGRFIPRRKRAERDFLKIAREQSLEESENKEKMQSQKRE